MKDLALSIDKEVDKFLFVKNVAVYELGKRFKKIRDDAYYEALGYDTFNSYIASKGVRSPKTVSAWIYVYELFVEHLKYSVDELVGIPWGKLQLLAPQVKEGSKKDADEWVEKARALSYGDLLLEVREEKANEGFKVKEPYPILYRCKACGGWVVPSELNKCKCK